MCRKNHDTDYLINCMQIIFKSHMCLVNSTLIIKILHSAIGCIEIEGFIYQYLSEGAYLRALFRFNVILIFTLKYHESYHNQCFTKKSD